MLFLKLALLGAALFIGSQAVYRRIRRVKSIPGLRIGTRVTYREGEPYGGVFAALPEHLATGLVTDISDPLEGPQVIVVRFENDRWYNACIKQYTVSEFKSTLQIVTS